MSLRKEIQLYVSGLQKNNTFTTVEISPQSGEALKALNKMHCVSNTGTKAPKTIDYHGGKLPDIWQRTHTLEDDLANAQMKKARGEKVFPNPSICKGCPTRKSWGGCAILNHEYWDRLK